jgi:hypothetical protein
MQYLKYIVYILSLVFLGSLSACVERINLWNEGMGPRLVITGLVSNVPGVYQIYLQHSSETYFGPAEVSMPTGYTDPAEVWIDEEMLTPSGNGTYITHNHFSVEPGQTCTLTVRCDYNKDGKIEEYKAITTVPKKYKLDSISLSPIRSGSDFPALMMVHYQDHIGDDFIAAYLRVNNDLYSNRVLRFGFVANNMLSQDGAYCNVPVSNWIIDDEMPHDNNTKYPIYRHDELMVEMVVLCPATYAFLDAARTEMGQSNPLFSGPRANLPSNISGGALGCFGSYTSSNAFMVVDSPELPERE